MDASHFNDFSFSYHGVPAQNTMGSMPDRFDNVAADHFVSQLPMTSTPGTSQSMAISAPTAFTSEHDYRPQSVDGSDDGAKDKSSPVGNSLEEPLDDEFGLASQRRGEGSDLGAKVKEDKAEAAPAWSELKTKAGKERKRLPLACIACRRKKIRCSGEKPACKHCLRSRIPCVYKVTTRKAAPRTDYMSMLDKRLKRMEERIIKVIPKAEQDTTSSITRAVVKPAMPGSLSANKGAAAAATKKRRAEEAFGPDLEAWANASARPNPAEEQRRASLQIQEAEEDALFREGIDALPPKEIQEHLAEVYFDFVYGQSYHLLHKPSYMRKLKNNTLPPVLVLSVCAVSARFTGTPKLNSAVRHFQRGEEWASVARDICTKRYEWPNITILTCLLILGLHEFGTCQGGRSWALGGQAIRMAFALQLHKDLEYDPNCRNKTKLSFIDREIRRRIMWSAFLMDRFNSSGLDRPMFVKEETIDIPLPVKERYFQLDMPVGTETLSGRVCNVGSPKDGHAINVRENMGVAAYIIRAVAVWGKIINYFVEVPGKTQGDQPMWRQGSEFWKLSKAAEDLLATLPESLTYSADNFEVHKTAKTGNQYLLLHMTIQQNILYLNKEAAASLSSMHIQEPIPETFVPDATSKAITAANRISEILRDSERGQCCVSAPFAGYCAYSSAMVHVGGISSSVPAIKALAESHSGINVRYLRKMMKHWGMFHWMVENIRTQYRKALDACRAGTPANTLAVAMPVLHYGDWFDKYPHGISDADFMDPALYKKKERGADGVLEQKPELQSVEEYMESLSPPQSTGSRDGTRGSAMKRAMVSKNVGARTGAPRLEPLMTDLASSMPDQMGGRLQQQVRRPSGNIVVQTSGPAAYHPAIAQHAQNNSFHALSPVSPVVTQFSGQGHPQQAFYPQNMLSMSLPPAANGMVQPIERHHSFGFPADASAMPGAQGFMDGMSDWNGMTADAHRAYGRRNMKGPMTGQHMQDHANMTGHTMDDSHPEWMVQFQLDPSEMNHDMGLGVGMGDMFGLMGGGSGMTTPNPLNGLQHGL
ncbi:fungal-specific transcription factor domain-containing protein [Stachybotrys elegans]|uniref:Fungal-specific transcription factor domain-containing protein n=1 Tax=Stachybotrys elegans TaxID=80388 RepID=A0A8K0WQS0_9HYPO|nr:fungal-specific transcription factor domain-containing protein [Stachybotrys elegans]